jgi:hypothetical protein
MAPPTTKPRLAQIDPGIRCALPRGSSRRTRSRRRTARPRRAEGREYYEEDGRMVSDASMDQGRCAETRCFCDESDPKPRHGACNDR